MLPTQAMFKPSYIAESIGSGKSQKFLHLVGKVMVADVVNANGRVYQRHEIADVMQFFKHRSIVEQMPVAGELNHPVPENLRLDLHNASHLIMDAWMEGNYGCAKLRIVETPAGNIVKALVAGGMRPGVSSRGNGRVGRNGVVEGFKCLTMDIVHNPSGPGCHPDILTESMHNTKIVSLSQAVCHDSSAQSYLQKEIISLMHKIQGK